MGNISIEINNREFLIACTDGDEDKVMKLALKFASRVKSIKERVGELDQQRLFLLAGILAEEENQELNDNLSIDEKEEFSAEETESSEIDDEFNQETEEELLDIPTFLRRQAN